METKVTQQDLIGDLKGFPIEVVEKMLQKQHDQYSKKDISIFQNNIHSERGFLWSNTIEGQDFWRHVISYKQFDIFFERYPRPLKNVYICGDRNNGKGVIEELESRGGINKYDYKGNAEDALYFIDPVTNYITMASKIEESFRNVLKNVYTEISPCKKMVELTMEEIAEKLGINVEQLRIKK